ncbi:hypothetical protein AB1K81_18360, partial [Ornithinibacillus sp. 179-J 7C1 HS]
AFKAEAGNRGFQPQSKPPVHTGGFDSTSIFIEDEVYGSIYKINTPYGDGYVSREQAVITEDEHFSQVGLEVFLPLFPDMFEQSYGFFFLFLNENTEIIEDNVQGLTDVIENQVGVSSLEYSNYSFSYLINEDLLSYGIEVRNINLNSQVIEDLKPLASLSSTTGDMYYFLTEEYEVLLDIGRERITFRLNN